MSGREIENANQMVGELARILDLST